MENHNVAQTVQTSFRSPHLQLDPEITGTIGHEAFVVGVDVLFQR